MFRTVPRARRATPSAIALFAACAALAMSASCAGPAARSEARATFTWPPQPLSEVRMERRSGIALQRVEVPELPAGFGAVAIARGDGTYATAFLSGANGVLAQRKPLLIWCEGSGAQSVFRRRDEGISGGLFAYLATEYADEFHVAVVEKRGLAIGTDAKQGGTAKNASLEYHEFATWEGRVSDGCLLIDALLQHENVDPSRVVVLGHSEGGDIASGMAAMRHEVTHCAILSGAGPCQWAELMWLARQQCRDEGLDDAEAEEAVRDLVASYRAIMAAPDSVDEMFYGHAYRRWSSFGSRPPIESLLAARAAIYVASGTRDLAAPVESLDLVEIELLRAGRTDVTVRRYPDADHSYKSPHVPPGDGIILALDAAMDWARSDGSAR